MNITDQTIAILGGTGPQGRGLARRFASCLGAGEGVEVLLGGLDRGVPHALITA